MATFSIKRKSSDVAILVRGVKHFGQFQAPEEVTNLPFTVNEEKYPAELQVTFEDESAILIKEGNVVELKDTKELTEEERAEQATAEQATAEQATAEQAPATEEPLSSGQRAMKAQIEARKARATTVPGQQTSIQDEISLRRSGKLRAANEIAKRRNRKSL